MSKQETYWAASGRLWRQFNQGELTAEQYKAQSDALGEQRKADRQRSNEQQPRITARPTTDGWHVDLDNEAWVHLMSALSIAIASEIRDGDLGGHLATFQHLRIALSQAERLA